MKVGFLPLDVAQVGAQDADVRRGRHLLQVGHEGLLAVQVDDGVADHGADPMGGGGSRQRYGGHGRAGHRRVPVGEQRTRRAGYAGPNGLHPAAQQQQRHGTRGDRRRQARILRSSASGARRARPRAARDRPFGRAEEAERACRGPGVRDGRRRCRVRPARPAGRGPRPARPGRRGAVQASRAAAPGSRPSPGRLVARAPRARCGPARARGGP